MENNLIAFKGLNFRDGVDLDTLTYYLPMVKNFNDIISALKNCFADNDTETKIIQKSKSSFMVEFSKGLCIHASFLFSTAKKTVKRIL